MEIWEWVAVGVGGISAWFLCGVIGLRLFLLLHYSDCLFGCKMPKDKLDILNSDVNLLLALGLISFVVSLFAWAVIIIISMCYWVEEGSTIVGAKVLYGIKCAGRWKP